MAMIEIEKKFLLTDNQLNKLLKGARFISKKVFKDVYFDTNDYKLTTQDYWLRLRENRYELKLPLTLFSASKTNRYHEITDAKEVANALNLRDDIDLGEALSEAGIKDFITVITERSSYEKEGFHIDIDSATYVGSNFKYAVSEIELLIESEDGANLAEQKIIEFATRLGLTVDKVIYGKVLAYLHAEKHDHYEALVRAGVSRVK